MVGEEKDVAVEEGNERGRETGVRIRGESKERGKGQSGRLEAEGVKEGVEAAAARGGGGGGGDDGCSGEKGVAWLSRRG